MRNEITLGGLIGLVVVGLCLLIGGIWGIDSGIKVYRIWSMEQDGKALHAESQWSKKVAVEASKAKLESASFLRQAEVERARGVAEANKIIGDSLKKNEAYLRYLWIRGLQDGSSEVIYVPTEANLPILEAGRRGGQGIGGK